MSNFSFERKVDGILCVIHTHIDKMQKVRLKVAQRGFIQSPAYQAPAIG